MLSIMPDPAPPIPTETDADEAWRAVLARDRRADGRFVFGVASTGIYCRPSCPARRPARENVRFFADGAAARAAGLRACRRCRPDEVMRDEAAVIAAIAAIKNAAGSGRPPTLAELAAPSGYSPAHFQRVFARLTGLSPAAYARALRQQRVAEALSEGTGVTEALYAAGYEAPSRFYAEAGRLGMSPSAWRDGGRGVAIRWGVAETSLGALMIAATDKGVCRVAFDEGEAELAARFPRATLEPGGPAFAGLVAEVVAAVEEPGRGGAAIPLDVQGTAFQEAVWRALALIPAGETRTYAELAAAAGHPRAVRAAGTANGANPVAVLVPCHRVVRGDGSLGGYAWGPQRKQVLLARERGLVTAAGPDQTKE